MEGLVGLTHFFLPEIRCSLPSQLHHEYEFVEERTNQFLLHAAQSRSEAERELLKQWKIPLFMCLANPEALLRRLIYATQIFSWGYLMDDALEEVAVERPKNELLKGVSAEAIWTIIDGRQPAAEMSSETMLAFKNVWDKVVGGMPASLRQRFVRNMKKHLRAQVVSTSNLSEGEHGIPSVASYISSRRMTSGAFVEFNLAEYSLGVDIEESILRSETMVALHSAAADHIAWVNDLFSFRKEYLRGEFHNLPSVICINSGCTFQGAVRRVCRLIQDREEDYLRLVKDEMKQQPGLRVYLRAVGSWMSANLHWSYQTARYHGVGNALVPLRSAVIHVKNREFRHPQSEAEEELYQNVESIVA